MTGYRCRVCDWIEERTTLPEKCHRCGAGRFKLLPLSKAKFLGMIDAVVVIYCKACEKVHSI